MAARPAPALDVEPQAISVPAASPVRLASGESAIPSPARALQAELAASWREEDGLAPIPGRWSGRKSLLVIVGSSALLWAAIIGGASYLLSN